MNKPDTVSQTYWDSFSDQQKKWVEFLISKGYTVTTGGEFDSGYRGGFLEISHENAHSPIKVAILQETNETGQWERRGWSIYDIKRISVEDIVSERVKDPMFQKNLIDITVNFILSRNMETLEVLDRLQLVPILGEKPLD